MTTKEDGYEKRVDPPTRSRDQGSQEETWKIIPQRRFPPRYKPIFYGHCYSCGSFGNRAAECRNMFGMNIIPGDPLEMDFLELDIISTNLII